MNPVDAPPATCPRCREVLSVSDSDCLVCGWPAPEGSWQRPVEPPAIGAAQPVPDFDIVPVAPLFLALGALGCINLCAPVVFAAFVDAVRLPLGLMVFLVTLYCGSIAAQICIAAGWAALGPQRLPLRLAGSLLTLTVLWITVLMGAAAVEPREFDEIFRIVAAAPLMYVAAQAPLWLARVLFGWRIQHENDPLAAGDAGAAQVRIRDLLLGTAAVALAFSAVRLGFSAAGRPDAGSALDWLLMLIAAVACAAFGALATLPCTWATLREKEPQIAMFGVAGCVCGAAAVIAAAVVFLFHTPASFTTCIALTFPAALFGVQFLFLLIARSCGFRLVRGDQRRDFVPLRSAGGG